MTWQTALSALVGLGILVLLVRALRGYGRQPARDEKDSADRWLHADATPTKPLQDAPVVDDAEGDGEGDSD